MRLVPDGYPAAQANVRQEMKLTDLPVFAVSAVQPDSPQLQGEVNRWCWVGEGHIAYLFLEDGTFVQGKFRNVDEPTRSVSFAFKQPDSAPSISPGESIRYFDGYWGERALISLDRTLDWCDEEFHTHDVIHQYMGGRTEVEKDGCTHDHCAICWATVSESENQMYKKSSQGDSVCLDCFRNHIEPQNIDFIEDA